MEELLRTRVERFGLTDAVKLDEVQKVMEEGNIERLILPVDRMFDQYPAAKTTPQGDLLVHNGNRIFPNCYRRSSRWMEVMSEYMTAGRHL